MKFLRKLCVSVLTALFFIVSICTSLVLAGELHDLGRSRNIDIVKAEEIIKRGADVNAFEEKRGVTPLDLAARWGNASYVKLLLSYGADPNLRKDSETPTPLHSALDSGHEEAAKLLIANGANVELPDPMFHYKAIHLAARSGLTNIVKLLISSGVDVDDRNSIGTTPLHVAAHFGEIEVAKLLIDKGAKVNATTSTRHDTPLKKAVNLDQKDVVDFLLENGATPLTDQEYDKIAQEGKIYTRETLLKVTGELIGITKDKIQFTTSSFGTEMILDCKRSYYTKVIYKNGEIKSIDTFKYKIGETVTVTMEADSDDSEGRCISIKMGTFN
jgi:ankyrin repeat protein